ncbi:MAG: hypothetical protein RR847_02440 [Bacilli bacterium]
MKKSYIIAAIILISYGLIMYLIFGTKIFDRQNNFLILDKNTKWEISPNWSDISESNDELYKGQKFKIYDDAKYLGEHIIKYYSNKLYIFDKNNDSIKINGQLLAIGGSKKIKVSSFEKEELNEKDLENLKEILVNKKIINYGRLSVNQKVNFDFDGDLKKEQLYLISNLYTEEDNDGYFTIVYYVDNDKTTILIEENYTIDEQIYGSRYELSEIINVDENKKSNFIIEKSYFNLVDKSCYQMFQFKLGKYISLKTCK